MSVRLIVGDCRERLRELESESVHTCICSPPYFALRDYGTGQWAGGDPDCDHIARRIRIGDNLAKFSAENYAGGGHQAGREKPIQFQGQCHKCGAHRLDQQIGQEQTPEQFVAALVEVMEEVRRVLRPDGTLWLNLGDTYAGGGNGGGGSFAQDNIRSARQGTDKNRASRLGSRGANYDDIKPKDLIGIPWMVAFALRRAGWWLRQDIIWHKTNTMPESVEDRCTKAHEYLFLLSKSARYYYDHEAIKEVSIYGPDSGKREAPKGSFAGRRPHDRQAGHLEQSFRAIRKSKNKRSVWTVPTGQFGYERCTSCLTNYTPQEHKRLRREKIDLGEGRTRTLVHCRCGSTDDWLSHFATFPPDLIKDCVLAGCPKGGLVLDPFAGGGTTGLVADRLQRNAVLIELNEHYASLAQYRLANDRPGFLDQMEAAE